MRKRDDIVGYWQTQSGAMYHFVREDGFIVATFHRPSDNQVSCGIQPGDLAFRGTLLGMVLVGTFQQRYPLGDRDRCPGAWLGSSTLYIQISDAFDRMTGTLLLEHLPDDSCRPDDRRLDALVFEPTTPDTKIEKGVPSAMMPAGKLFTSGG